MMTARQVRRLRARIELPDYWEDRCVQMGELYGYWYALRLLGVPNAYETKMRYYRRMHYYARKTGRI